MSAPAKTKEKSSRLPVARILFALMGAVTVAIACLYVFYHAEQFIIRNPQFVVAGEGRARTFEIAGIVHSSRAELETVFAPDLGRSVYLVPLVERQKTLETVEWVRQATISRQWPNRLMVRVRERVPVAFVTLERSRPGLIDEDGAILPSVSGRFRFPVLAGIRSRDSLEIRREQVHNMQRVLNELGPEAAEKVSEVDATDRDNMKVTLTWEEHIFTLFLGDSNFAARYRKFVEGYGLIQADPVAKKKLPPVAVLDLRGDRKISVVPQ